MPRILPVAGDRRVFEVLIHPGITPGRLPLPRAAAANSDRGGARIGPGKLREIEDRVGHIVVQHHVLIVHASRRKARWIPRQHRNPNGRFGTSSVCQTAHIRQRRTRCRWCRLRACSGRALPYPVVVEQAPHVSRPPPSAHGSSSSEVLEVEPSPLVTCTSGRRPDPRVRHVGDLDIAVPIAAGGLRGRSGKWELRDISVIECFTSRAGGSQERCGALNWQSRQKVGLWERPRSNSRAWSPIMSSTYPRRRTPAAVHNHGRVVVHALPGKYRPVVKPRGLGSDVPLARHCCIVARCRKSIGNVTVLGRSSATCRRWWSRRVACE